MAHMAHLCDTIDFVFTRVNKLVFSKLSLFKIVLAFRLLKSGLLWEKF
jgi:hypothetical protein